MYFSVRHIDVKLNQDYSDFSNYDEKKSLVLCDGIGEFADSGVVAQQVVEKFINKNYLKLSEVITDNDVISLKNKKLIGGTTFISAVNLKNTDKVKIEYLGNGGIIHLHGDYSTNVNSEEPYRYGEIMIPHISPSGALTKHISHNSEKIELATSTIELNLNYITGDVILLFSDGISSLEDKVILKDNENRFWRNENPAIQLILSELNLFLKTNISPRTFQDELIGFNQTILEKLKAEKYLDDDASLGIIITENVLNYYREQVND
jgi:serine/threonine protein phosphatase PrpC